MDMRHELLLALVAFCGCKKPLPEAILGDWEVWCYTDTDTASCLSKERAGLRKTFHSGGGLDVRRADDSGPSSDKATWTLVGDELTFTISGGGLQLVEHWRARVEGDRLVLWDASKGRGQVLGRVGSSFEPAQSPVAKGGREKITLNGVTFSMELPDGSRQTRNDKHRQSWAPASGDGFEVQLSVTPRPQRGENGNYVTPPCNDADYGGVSGSSNRVNGVERETSIGTSICLDGTELVLMCSTEHSRGYLEASEKAAALALCKTIER